MFLWFCVNWFLWILIGQIWVWNSWCLFNASLFFKSTTKKWTLMDNYKGQICRTRMITFFGVNQQFAVQICVFEMLKKLTSIQLAIWSPVCYFWYEEQTWWQLLSFRCLSLGCCLFPNGRPTGCAAVWCSVYSQRPCFTLRRVSDGGKRKGPVTRSYLTSLHSSRSIAD